MKRLKTKKGIALLLTLVVVCASAIGAYAYWTTNGTGVGSAATSHDTGVTITQDASTPASGLYPSTTFSQPIDFTIHNAGPSAQYVTAVTVAVDPTWTSGTSAHPCTAADFAVTQPNAIAADEPVGATDVPSSGASIRMIDAAYNQNDCKSLASVPLVFSSN